MTAEEMGRITLAELEAMADRFKVAVAVIKDAQSLLGGAPAAVAAPVPVPAPAIVRGAPNPMLSAAENAERARLIKQNFTQEDLDAMERQ